MKKSEMCAAAGAVRRNLAVAWFTVVVLIGQIAGVTTPVAAQDRGTPTHDQLAKQLALTLVNEIADASRIALRPFHRVEKNILTEEVSEQLYATLMNALSEATIGKETLLTRQLGLVYDALEDLDSDMTLEDVLDNASADIEILCSAALSTGGVNLTCDATDVARAGEVLIAGGANFPLEHRVMLNLTMYALADGIVQRAPEGAELGEVRFTEQDTGCESKLGDYFSMILEEYIPDRTDIRVSREWQAIGQDRAATTYDLEGVILRYTESIELVVRMRASEGGRRLRAVRREIEVSYLRQGLADPPAECGGREEEVREPTPRPEEETSDEPAAEDAQAAVDRAKYLRGMERAYQGGEHEKVLEYVDLLEQGGGELPLVVWYYQGQSYVKLGRLEEASRVLSRYAQHVGEGGERFDEVVDLLLELDERVAADDAAWEQARSSGTSAAYGEYLGAYPQGRHAEEAQRLRAEAADDAAYERATDTGTSSAYGLYLSTYPSGRHVEEAGRKQQEARDDEAYERAKTSDTAASYATYLSTYPSGRHAEEARGLQAAARDDEAFARAKSAGTADGYEAYLRTYGSGRHAEEAQVLRDATARKEALEKPGRAFRDCDECPELVVVPTGSFMMGSPESEESRGDDEGPRYLVRIGAPIAVGRYEVTRDEFGRFVMETGYDAGSSCQQHDGGWDSGPTFRQTAHHPVVCVNWHDANVYMSWLRSVTGKSYRLLSASEWEYVARGGTTTPFHTGKTISTDQANYNGNHTYDSGRIGQYRKGATPVGMFDPNEFGLFDVHGNVWEWVADCRTDSYDGAPRDGSAWKTGDCASGSRRGGAWDNDPQYLRSANRASALAWNRLVDTGFRVARTFGSDAEHLRDDEAFALATRRGTVDAYQEYLRMHPHGLHEFEVRKLWSRAMGETDRELRSRLGSRFRDCEGCPEMVVVPAGSFMMGSPESEEGRRDTEGPVHRVAIDAPFAVGMYEVTTDEFSRFVSETGHIMGDACFIFEDGEWKMKEGRRWNSPGYRQTDRDPVVCVRWHDAQTYVSWLRARTGAEYRLLSESEWEYVARGGTSTARYWGESESAQCRHENGADRQTGADWAIACDDGYSRTAPVGTYRENGYGLYDVLGNVLEWTEDCWNGSYAGAPTDGSAWERGECRRRVVRGGSWNNEPRILRSAHRYRVVIGNRLDIVGFRVARMLAS